MGCIEGMCLERWNAAHSEDQAAASGFGVQKILQFVQEGQFKAGF